MAVFTTHVVLLSLFVYLLHMGFHVAYLSVYLNNLYNVSLFMGGFCLILVYILPLVLVLVLVLGCVGVVLELRMYVCANVWMRMWVWMCW